MSLVERFGEYVRACFTGLWIESHEHQDALMAIALLCRQEQWRLTTWDIEQGLRVEGAKIDEPGLVVELGDDTFELLHHLAHHQAHHAAHGATRGRFAA